VAAAVVLVFAAYCSVAGLFPRDGVSGSGIRGDEIMRKLDRPAKQLSPVENQRTPAGKDAQVFEEQLPSGGQAIIIIGPSGSKGPR
jgi:hypothetical protein